MAGVAPGRETESGGFGDVDKAGQGGFRVGSAHFFASALIVSLRRRTRKLRTRNEWIRQSSVRLAHARSSGATACVAHAATPLRSRRFSLPAKLRSHRVHARPAAPLGLADERFP
jgi:hypothetical protein